MSATASSSPHGHTASPLCARDVLGARGDLPCGVAERSSAAVRPMARLRDERNGKAGGGATSGGRSRGLDGAFARGRIAGWSAWLCHAVARLLRSGGGTDSGAGGGIGGRSQRETPVASLW